MESHCFSPKAVLQEFSSGYSWMLPSRALTLHTIQKISWLLLSHAEGSGKSYVFYMTAVCGSMNMHQAYNINVLFKTPWWSTWYGSSYSVGTSNHLLVFLCRSVWLVESFFLKIKKTDRTNQLSGEGVLFMMKNDLPNDRNVFVSQIDWIMILEEICMECFALLPS